MDTILRFNATHPDTEQRVSLTQLADAYQKSTDPNDLSTETVSASKFIYALMEFAGIEYDVVDPMQERDEAETNLDNDPNLAGTVLDIMAMLGANQVWSDDATLHISEALGRTIRDNGLPKIDGSQTPEALAYWRRMADLRNIEHDGEE